EIYINNFNCVHYQQESQHDPEYPEEDYRNEKIEKGTLAASLKILQGCLRVEKLQFISNTSIYQSSQDSVQKTSSTQAEEFASKALN
ncbi:MAG: hypothetical protein AAFW84_33945, partial [Cyanobacteria bacterium J06635_15]